MRILACLFVLGLGACDGSGLDAEPCAGGKCDDPSQLSAGELMPRAPETSGAINMSRNQSSWLFEVIGDKGEIVLLSQNYTQRDSALAGVLSVEDNGVLAERYVVRQSDAGWAFELRAANNEVLGDSQLFSSQAEADAAVVTTRDLIAGIVQYKAALNTGAAFQLGRQSSAWNFELRDAEGQLQLRSQEYSRRRDAITGIESVRNNGKNPARYTIVDQPVRFVLKASNGQEIAESATTFENREAAQAAITQIQALLLSERVANPW